MRRLRRALKRLGGAAGRGVNEADLAAEFEEHLWMQTEENIRLGMSPHEARRQARLKFGGLEAAKESYRDQHGLPQVQTLMRDVRYAARVLRRSPGFTLAAGLSLALGIAATAALFSSLVNATLLRPLPYASPDKVATVLRASRGSRYQTVSAPYFLEFSRSARSLEGAALYFTNTFRAAGPAEPERIPGARVSAGLFDVLGVQPALGRGFAPVEDREGGPAVAVISDGLWKRRFAGDPLVIGSKLDLNGAPHTIIGVMPPGFEFPEGPETPAGTISPISSPAQIWRPMALSREERTTIWMSNYAMIARLRDGVSSRQAEAELNAIGERVFREYRGGRRCQFNVVTIADALTRKTRVPVLILFAAVLAALLLACVNVASLLLARGLHRRPEIAMRIALGASRLRIVRQLLTESLVLALGAGCLALPLSYWAMRGLAAVAPAEMPALANAGFDLRMLAFGFGLTLATALVFGAVPAFQAAWRAPGDLVKVQGRTSTASPSRLRKLLLAAEFALALVLLAGAGLLARSFLEVSRAPLGFHAENLLTMRSSLPDHDGAQRAALIEQLADRCSALPGVTAAAAVSTLPFTGDAEGWGAVAEDNPDSKEGITLRVRAVTPSYFQTMGIPLRAGRAIGAGDRGAPPIGVITESAARRLWPDVADPLGRRVKTQNAISVVGIVGDTRASGLDREVLPYLYVPFSQFSPPEFALTVRTANDPAALVAAVKAEVRDVVKHQPITDIAIMRQLVSDSIAPRRFQTLLMSLFAGFALVLAALGIYGVVAYSAAQRTHEIGIRMALGASRWDVVRAVVRESAGLALLGTAAGLLGSLALAPLLRSLLYGVSATDPAALSAAAAVLVGVAGFAALVPASRAARTDPAKCLRAE